MGFTLTSPADLFDLLGSGDIPGIRNEELEIA
jgi:hypothetical protein